MHDRWINEHDNMDLIIWLDRNLVDPGIRVNSQVKSIFTDLEKKGMFAITKRGIGQYYQVRIPLKMSLNENRIIFFPTAFIEMQ